MGRALRVLIVEDLEYDAQLVLRELRRGDFDVTHERVDTPEAMALALAKPWDVVLSDYSMPRFTGPMALRMLQERGIDVPFIIISGTVNEDIAVEALHAGAHDFMSKGNLPRLLPAIDRELRNVVLRAEQRKLQDQLMISDRMASMGTLAAGVAHEINNPLACVMANLDLATRDIAGRTKALGVTVEFSEIHEELRDAREAVERIRNIVRDLKVFSHTQEQRTGPIDVTRVLESTLRMAWTEVRHRARLVKDYGTTPPVQASESRLGQVFLNLVVNAAQAIGEGHAHENEIRVTTRSAADGNVLIEISDTGPGMPPEVVSKLFTPFFTTKAVGVGTGLGLSICHRIITGLGGTIDVDTAIGRGTTFRVTLPQAHSVVSKSTPPAAVEIAAARRGRVLVVDDEPMVTRVVERTLSAEHDVVTTNKAADALTALKSGERFDVILCDLMMPHMTGMDLHAELHKVDPDAADRMVFLTGGAFSPAARAFLEQAPHARIEKPFEGSMLRALVNERVLQAD